ncbi:MAG: hypothetical protein EAZ09_21685 [Oscillatoriales cyanobacterium]|nr:MAG: hypothetical protein EAZ18_18595 [Oscillatoriales cyanobacterium]TAH16457.1 MAG: hypothetical protein EAZ09_21685 [Oscillatoriales cyanobacterium]
MDIPLLKSEFAFCCRHLQEYERIGNRESGIRNRELGIGHCELGIGHWALRIGHCESGIRRDGNAVSLPQNNQVGKRHCRLFLLPSSFFLLPSSDSDKTEILHHSQ